MFLFSCCRHYLEERDARATDAVRAALDALDAAERSAMGVYRVAAAALDLNRRMCDAVDVMSIHSHAWVASYHSQEGDGVGSHPAGDALDADTPSFDWIKVAIDEGWATARRLVGAAWARGRYDLVNLRREALSLGDKLERAEVATRDAAADANVLQEAKAEVAVERVAAAEARAAAAEAKAEARVAEAESKAAEAEAKSAVEELNRRNVSHELRISELEARLLSYQPVLDSVGDGDGSVSANYDQQSHHAQSQNAAFDTVYDDITEASQAAAAIIRSRSLDPSSSRLPSSSALASPSNPESEASLMLPRKDASISSPSSNGSSPCDGPSDSGPVRGSSSAISPRFRPSPRSSPEPNPGLGTSLSACHSGKRLTTPVSENRIHGIPESHTNVCGSPGNKGRPPVSVRSPVAAYIRGEGVSRPPAAKSRNVKSPAPSAAGDTGGAAARDWSRRDQTKEHETGVKRGYHPVKEYPRSTAATLTFTSAAEDEATESAVKAGKTLAMKSNDTRTSSASAQNKEPRDLQRRRPAHSSIAAVDIGGGGGDAGAADRPSSTCRSVGQLLAGGKQTTAAFTEATPNRGGVPRVAFLNNGGHKGVARR